MDESAISEDPESWKADIDPDAYLSYEKIVERYGFIYGSHTVKTPDGYLLEIEHV